MEGKGTTLDEIAEKLVESGDGWRRFTVMDGLDRLAIVAAYAVAGAFRVLADEADTTRVRRRP